MEAKTAKIKQRDSGWTWVAYLTDERVHSTGGFHKRPEDAEADLRVVHPTIPIVARMSWAETEAAAAALGRR